MQHAEKEVDAKTKEIMEYEHEKDAMATFVGKVVPVVAPDLVFCEEGCDEMEKQSGKPFLVVSPDGSLRRNKELTSTEIAVEFKCPYFKLQTQVPSRYILQCISEMEALEVEQLFYLCWRPDEPSVFKISR